MEAGLARHGADLRLGYGTFHQHYRIDGVLVAVGVVDVLPHCLSSVYCFYDPDLGRTLELGKLTALWEIGWTARAMRASLRLRHYYMGYYVHSCPKMRYKAEYSPSELLCPHSRSAWVPASVAAPLLDADKRAVLDPQLRAAAGLVETADAAGATASVSEPDGAAAAAGASGPSPSPTSLQAIHADLRRSRLAMAAAALPGLPLLLRAVEPGALAVAADLTPDGRRIVAKAAGELLERCSPALAQRLVVLL